MPATPGAIYIPATPWQGAELTISNRQTTRIAIGTITNIPTTGSPDSLILEQAYGAKDKDGNPMPGLGSTYPGNSQWVCVSIRFVPISGTVCRVIHTYSTVDWGQSLYLIRDSTTLEQMQCQQLPGPTKVPFRVKYQNPANPGLNIQDSVTLDISIPIRSIDITQISFGAAPTAIRPYVGYCNSDPFLGLAAGFWLISRFESDISRYASSYQCTASIVTRTVEDWSQVGVLKAQNGVYIDATDGLAAAYALPYSYGIIYPPAGGGGSGTGGSGSNTSTGVIRVGPYQTTSLNTLFPSLNAADGGGPALPFGGGGPFPTG